jgi:hypothetical protein
MGRFDALIGGMVQGNRLRSVADYEKEYADLDAAKQAMSINKMKMDAEARAVEQGNKLRQYYATNDPTNPGFGRGLGGIDPKAMYEHQKAIDESAKANVEVKDKTSQITKRDYEVSKAKLIAAREEVSAMTTPQEADEAIMRYMASGDLAPAEGGQLRDGLRRMPFPQWQQTLVKMLMTAKDRVDAEQKQAKFEEDKRQFGVTSAETGRHNKASEGIQFGQLSVSRERLNFEKKKDKEDTADPGKYTQVIVDPNLGPIVVDRKTNKWTPVIGASGEKVEGKNITDAKKLESQLSVGIEEARKLIPIATGSGAGRLVDYATSAVGVSTKGDDASTQLETLAGWMTSNVPRMQGPQSDKDTLLYKQMAAQVGDRTKTRSARLSALDTLEKLQKKYSKQGGADDRPVKINNDAEYNALPKGTRFETPDGKTGTKS